MNRTRLRDAIALPVVVAVLSGCGSGEAPAPSGHHPGASNAGPQFEQVRKETREALSAARDYAFGQKAEFTEVMRGELAVLNSEIEKLAARVESSGADAKAEAKVKLHALRDQAVRLSGQLDRVKGATESTWTDVKSGVRRSADDFKESLNRARQWISEKVAP